MTIAHCPKCRERVSLPSGASRQAQVRCPLCSEEYLLGDALRDLPPMLLVIHDPESGSDETLEAPPRPIMVSRTMDQEGELPVLVGDSVEELTFAPAAPAAAPEFKFEPGSAVSRPRSSPSTARSRPRKKQGSGLRLVVQTVGGGVMGLVIAQLILWWMPGNWEEGNRDPFGLAATVSHYVPAIVPTSLRRPSPTTQANSGTSPQANDFTFNTDPSPAAKTAPGNPANKKNKSQKKESPEKLEEFPLPGLNEPSKSDIASREPDPAAPPPINFDPFDVPTKTTGEKMKAAAPDDAPAELPVEPPAVTTPLVEEKPAKTAVVPEPAPVPNNQIQTELKEVAVAEQAWNTAENPSNEQKVKLITDLYLQLAELGAAISPSETAQSDPAAIQPVVEKLNSLAAQPDKLTPLGRLAAIRMKEGQDAGAIVVGVVVSHQSNGTLHQTQVRLLARNDPIITLVSPVDLSEQLPVNAQIVALGRWVSSSGAGGKSDENSQGPVLIHGAHAKVPQTP